MGRTPLLPWRPITPALGNSNDEVALCPRFHLSGCSSLFRSLCYLVAVNTLLPSICLPKQRRGHALAVAPGRGERRLGAPLLVRPLSNVSSNAGLGVMRCPCCLTSSICRRFYHIPSTTGVELSVAELLSKAEDAGFEQLVRAWLCHSSCK